MSMQRSPPRRSPRNPPTVDSLPVTVSRQPTGSMSAGADEGVNVAQMPPVPHTSSSTARPSSESLTTATEINTSVRGTNQPTLNVQNTAPSFLLSHVPPPLTPAPGVSSHQTPMTSFPNQVAHPEMENLQRQIDVLQAQLLNAQRALKAATTTNRVSNPPSMPMSNGTTPAVPDNIAGTSNSSGPEDIMDRRDSSPFFFASTDATMAPCYQGQQQMLAAQPQSVQQPTATYQVQSLMPTPRKIYDLPEFNGAAEDWPMFLSAFHNTTAAYGYSHFENCLRLQKALKGEARECVKSLLIHPNNVPTVIEQLKFQYGRPELLIRCQLQQVREILPIGENAVEKLIPFSVKVRNLAAFLETANGHQHLSNPTLMEELVQKLPMSRRLDWAQYAASLRQWPTVLDFSNWLQGVANLVRSIQTASTSTSRPNNSESKKRVVLYASDVQRREIQCPHCRGQHRIFECKKFLSLTVQNRWTEVKKLRLCFSCLSGGHSSRDCRRRKECQIENCRRKHNKLLHEDQPSVSNANNSSNLSSADSGKIGEPVLSCVSSIFEKNELLFRVLPVKLYGPNCVVETYALLDEGSSVTMMDSALVRQLGLQGRQSKLNLNWYGGKSSQEVATVVDLHVSGVNKQRKYALKNVYGVSNLKLPNQSFDANLIKNHGIPIASYGNVAPKLLIGLDHCHLGLPDEIVPLEEAGPYAANTPLGWIVFGNLKGGHPTARTCLLTAQPDNLYDLVASYFETENFGVKALPVIESEEVARAQKILNDSTKRVAGRFQSRLLWCHDDVVLPDSHAMALNRLYAMERKMKRNPDFGVAYKNIIADYEKKGYVRKLTSSEAQSCNARTWYLPHFGVINPNKPGKIRLVFDAAAKVEGVSLNSNLLKGPQKI